MKNSKEFLKWIPTNLVYFRLDLSHNNLGENEYAL